MTKKRSKCLFVLFSIILVVLLIASFVNFTYPFSVNGNYYSYSNFVSNLKLGEDISSSYRFVYRADLPNNVSGNNLGELKTATMEGLKSIVQSEGYKDATVAEYAENYVILQVGNLLTKQDETNINYLVGEPKALSIYTSSTQNENNLVATAQDVESVEVVQGYDGSDNVYIVEVKFKDELKDSIASKTKGANAIYIFFGDEVFTPDGMKLGSEGITDGIIPIQSSAFVSEIQANSYANKIRTGMLPLNLTAISHGTISASYGSSTAILLYIATMLAVLAGFIFLIVKYKQLGWLACFNLLFFITIGLFLLQSIPLVHINFSGIIAMIICFIVAVDSLITIFERAKAYYNNDTKLYISMKAAQKDSLFKILINNFLVSIVGLICLFMPAMSIQSLGWVLFVLPLLNLFTSLVMMRLFIKMYLALNPFDGKKCNFNKGGKNV